LGFGKPLLVTLPFTMPFTQDATTANADFGTYNDVAGDQTNGTEFEKHHDKEHHNDSKLESVGSISKHVLAA
jgi:hypothetical protein